MSKNKKITIYLGGPLFTESEQAFNRDFAKRIRERFGSRVFVYVPQENEAINDKSGYADSIMIAEGDNAYLEEADILIANMDGQTMDIGMASEVGFFYHFNRPILGLYSDVRQGTYGNKKKLDALDTIAESQFSYVNLYTVGLIKKRGSIYQSTEEILDAIDEISTHEVEVL